LIGSQRDNRPGGRGKRRRPRPHGNGHGHAPRAERIVLTEEGVPASTPDAPPVSPVVFVTAETRKRYPWIPARVIAGSVWRGPGHVRVRVDERGEAAPWKTGRVD
jgi:hypothetical protein